MKTIFLSLLLLSVAFIASTQVPLSLMQMVGGYSEVHQEQLHSLRSDQSFLRSEEAARKIFAERNSGSLGQLVKVYQQVVAGMNYKLIFETSAGQVEVDVFAQPWTETYDVTNIQPVYKAN